MPTRCAAPCRVLGALLAGVLVAAACSEDDAAPASTAPPTSQATTTTVRADDGVLRVGAVLPDPAGVPDFGASIRAGLDVASADINTLGVLGDQVVVDVRPEGDSPSAALTAVQQLVDSGVDAIIGPTASSNVLATLSTAVEAGVLMCSPTAAAMTLDDYPDDRLFFRTVPSDSLQALGIARVAVDLGSDDVVIAYVDDAYGRPFALAVQAALSKAIPDAVTVPFPAGQVPSTTAVEAVVQADPDVVIVLADATFGPAIVTAVDAALIEARGPRTDDAVPTEYVVNDQMRRPDPDSPIPDDLLGRLRGVAPRAMPPSTASAFLDALTAADPSASGVYAVNAYDCLTLIALGAQAAGSTDGMAIHDQLPELTSAGRSCTSFSDCTAFAETTPNINYNGPSGSLTIADGGDPSGATFEVFRTDPADGEEKVATLPIGVE